MSRKTSTPELPANWGPHLRYLTRPLYSPSLTQAHLCTLRKTPSPSPSDPGSQPEDLGIIPASLPLGPSRAVLILPITDRAHPAFGQHGLFAARDLRPGELVVRYLGEIHAGTWGYSSASSSPDDNREGQGENEKNPHADSDYGLWLDREGDLAVDAARAGNEARFVNDYRGVPPHSPSSVGNRPGGARGKSKSLTKRRPNAEFRAVWDERLRERGMGVFVLPAGKKAVGREREVGIANGEEILVSYGKGFWAARKTQGEGKDVAEDEAVYS